MMTLFGCSIGARRFGARGVPWLPIVLAATLLAGVAQRACAQTAKQANTLEYETRKRKALFDASQRHLNLGAWLRKQGLIPQATNELLRAVEVGEGVNQGAETVLSAMRSYGDAFWRIVQRRPSKDMLVSYANQHEAIEKQTRLARTLLVLYASSSGLGDEARAQCLAVLKLGGAELEIGSGQKSTRLEGHPLPAALGEWLAKRGDHVVCEDFARAGRVVGAASDIQLDIHGRAGVVDVSTRVSEAHLREHGCRLPAERGSAMHLLMHG